MTGLLDAPPASGAEQSVDLLESHSARPADSTRTTSPRTGRTGRTARLGPLWRPAGYYLASRAVIFVTAFVTAAIYPRLRVVGTFGSAFDGSWYIRIAQHGYPHQLVNEGDGSRWAFFPAFPAIVRAVSAVTRLSLPDAATLAAFVFGLTATLAIWLAIREVFGVRLADRSALLFVCCPTAFVLSFGYTEGLFLTLAALCLYALSRRWYVAAGLCAFGAGLTRNMGIAVVAAVLVTAIPAAWRGRALRPALGAAIAPLGLAAFMAYSWAMVGTPTAFMTAERFWHGQHFVWFTTPVLALARALQQGPGAPAFVSDAMAGAALVLGFAGIWLLDRLGRQPEVLLAAGPTSPASPPGPPTSARSAVPASWWVYVVGTLLLAYCAYLDDSIPRYVMAAFPLFVGFAWKLPQRTVGLAAGLLLCLQSALLVGVLMAFVHPVAVPLIP